VPVAPECWAVAGVAPIRTVATARTTDQDRRHGKDEDGRDGHCRDPTATIGEAANETGDTSEPGKRSKPIHTLAPTSFESRPDPASGRSGCGQRMIRQPTTKRMPPAQPKLTSGLW